MTAVAVFSYFAEVRPTALAALFQGGIALPLAFLLERRMGSGALPKDHPLTSLIVLMALVQILAVPAAVLMYDSRPEYVAGAFAAIVGGHFLPYVWLYRTRIYLGLALAVSIGGVLLTVAINDRADRAVFTWWAACYGVGAVALLRLNRQRR